MKFGNIAFVSFQWRTFKRVQCIDLFREGRKGKLYCVEFKKGVERGWRGAQDFRSGCVWEGNNNTQTKKEQPTQQPTNSHTPNSKHAFFYSSVVCHGGEKWRFWKRSLEFRGMKSVWISGRIHRSQWSDSFFEVTAFWVPPDDLIFLGLLLSPTGHWSVGDNNNPEKQAQQSPGHIFFNACVFRLYLSRTALRFVVLTLGPIEISRNRVFKEDVSAQHLKIPRTHFFRCWIFWD